MELTSKQRAQLRGMAATMDTILHVGKDGIGDNLVLITLIGGVARQRIQMNHADNHFLLEKFVLFHNFLPLFYLECHLY